MQNQIKKNKTSIISLAIIGILYLILSTVFPKNEIFNDENEPAITEQASKESMKDTDEIQVYEFRNLDTQKSHYKKHGHEFGDITMDEYLEAANLLLNEESSEVLTTIEEDGDMIYYKESTNEFLVLSTDGYIRTYFRPDDGIDYFNRQ